MKTKLAILALILGTIAPAHAEEMYEKPLEKLQDNYVNSPYGPAAEAAEGRGVEYCIGVLSLIPKFYESRTMVPSEWAAVFRLHPEFLTHARNLPHISGKYDIGITFQEGCVPHPIRYGHYISGIPGVVFDPDMRLIRFADTEYNRKRGFAGAPWMRIVEDETAKEPFFTEGEPVTRIGPAFVRAIPAYLLVLHLPKELLPQPAPVIQPTKP